MGGASNIEDAVGRQRGLGGEEEKPSFSPFLCQPHRFSPLPLCQATREASCRRWTLWLAGGGSIDGQLQAQLSSGRPLAEEQLGRAAGGQTVALLD